MRMQTAAERKAADDFILEQATLLAEIPKAFHPFVRVYAWEQGHSSGYQEVLNIEGELIYHLTKAIESYKLELSKTCHELSSEAPDMRDDEAPEGNLWREWQ